MFREKTPTADAGAAVLLSDSCRRGRARKETLPSGRHPRSQLCEPILHHGEVSQNRRFVTLDHHKPTAVRRHVEPRLASRTGVLPDKKTLGLCRVNAMCRIDACGHQRIALAKEQLAPVARPPGVVAAIG